MMDDANRIALEKAFELYSRHSGQPWTPENLVAAAEKFRAFLETESLEEKWVDRIMWLTEVAQETHDRISALENGQEPKRTRQRSASAATNTTPPDNAQIDAPIHLVPGDIPTPVDF